MPERGPYWTKRVDQQFTCEELMGDDYYDQCMCGANGDHKELHRFIDENPERFARDVIGA